MTRKAVYWRAICVAGFLIAPRIALTDPPGPVKACVSDTQQMAGLNLAQALAAGGVIRFQCPPGATIAVSGRYVLNTPTLIDGGDSITLDGRGGFGPMLTTSKNIILRRLTVRGFSRRATTPPTPPFVAVGRISGSVLTAFGDAELDHVNVQSSDFPVSIRGTATVDHAVFTGNRGGVTLTVDGPAHIESSQFTGNGQALSVNSGWVRGCDFRDQTSTAVSVIGAKAALEIRHSTFSGIRGGTALRLSQRSGVGTSQTITIRDNVFRDNDGGSGSGAVAIFDSVQEARNRGQSASVLKVLAALPPAAFVLSYNRFNNNHGGRGGAIGADLAHTLGMISTADLFLNNTATGDGGAIVVSGGLLTISHAVFKGNRAAGAGAALLIQSDASAALANSLVVRNAGSGAAISGSAMNLVNVTIADNDAAGLQLASRLAAAANVLLARNHPSDCLRVPAGVFTGGGMQSDGSCPGVPVGEAFLDPFYVPAAGSPALQAGDPAFCRGALVGAVDLPFQARPGSTACALGAFERAPLDKLVSKSDRTGVHASPKDDFPEDGGYHPIPSSGTSSGRAPSPPTTYPAPTYPPSTYPAPTQTPPAYTPTRAPVPPASPPAPSAPHYSTTAPAPTRAPDNTPWWKRVLTGRPATAPAGASTAALVSLHAALAAEAAAPLERVHMFMTRGAISDDYYLDRVGSRRFHMQINPREGGPEVIVIDARQWARISGKSPWRNAPYTDAGSVPTSLAHLFDQGMTHPVEKVAGDGSRTVQGAIAWSNGGSCDGQLLLKISSAGLPSLLQYEGLCGGTPVRFHQVFSFAGPLSIEPPQ